MNARLADPVRVGREDGIVCCVAGPDRYGLRASDVRQVMRVDRMPGEAAPDGRVGTIEVGGETAPVFELAGVLKRPRAPFPTVARDGQYILVTGHAGELTGWLVDGIARTPLSPDTEIVPLPAVVGMPATNWFDAVVKLEDRSLLVLTPLSLSPRARESRAPDSTPAFVAPPAIHGTREPLVVIFSSPALPGLATRLYGLSGRQIAAIVHPLDVIHVPGSAPHVMGVAWWRGAVVPVIAFKQDGDRDPASSCRRWIIAQTSRSGMLLAFPIDPEVALHRATSADRRVVDGQVPPCALGMFDVEGRTVALVDLESLIPNP